MHTLTIERPVPFVMHTGPLTLLLAGCGGTGSHLAQALARIAAHTRSRRTDLRIIFCDGDTVEEKNVGRQLFTPRDVGHNKSQALAARFNALFGLAIEALPEMATVDRLLKIGGQSRRAPNGNGSLGILIGAVDSATARKSLHSALLNQRCWHGWLDCGNHENAGQVLFGTETQPARLADAVKVGICTKLPAPSIVAPDLLAATPRRQREDCAAAMEDNVQSLMVNQMMASIASEYLAKLIIHRRLTTFQTIVDLGTLTMRSTPVTAGAIRQVVDAYQDHQQRRADAMPHEEKERAA
ncbi:MAG: ThiF family adenylyltransferase [Kouleothrix sp.]|nr:ThiF family adenylyltransferase [Kouleothrix sp.]